MPVDHARVSRPDALRESGSRSFAVRREAAAEEEWLTRSRRGTAGAGRLAATQARALQGTAGNGAVNRLLAQRKIAQTTVDPVSQLLGIKGTVQAVEVPKDKKVTAGTPFSAYPKDNVLNLGALDSVTMLELQYPGLDDPEMKAMPADDIVDMMGGGAYNPTKDLVVLGQGYSQAALVHEMGHKAQNESGMNTATAAISVLEYHNFVYSENINWANKKTDAKPRLGYANPVPKPPSPAKSWDDLKKAAEARFHHDKPETSNMLESLEVTLESGRYQEDGDKKGKYGDQIKANLISEYFKEFPK